MIRSASTDHDPTVVRAELAPPLVAMAMGGDGYSPVLNSDGTVRVELSADHPGFGDADYRARRDVIARLALDYLPGAPIPPAPYTEEEEQVWVEVMRELPSRHAEYACTPYRKGLEALDLPTDRIPQLDEVSEKLAGLTGFRYRPAAGLVPLREFYGSLAVREFWSTQYIRHHSVPLYTPEPDVIHEVAGHGATLASQDYLPLYLAAGRAALRLESVAALQCLSRVFWFSLEFGVVYENSALMAYGPGILSSFGELQNFRSADLRPLDIGAMATTTYDITHYQPVLFAANSWSEMLDVVGGFFDSVDDETPERLGVTFAAVPPA